MNKASDLTEMVFVLDKSGSMEALESDTIGGFNSMIAKQKTKKGKAIVTTVLFDSSVFILHDAVDIEWIGKMADNDYIAGGCTALLDAVGTTITNVGKRQKNMKRKVFGIVVLMALAAMFLQAKVLLALFVLVALLANCCKAKFQFCKSLPFWQPEFNQL